MNLTPGDVVAALDQAAAVLDATGALVAGNAAWRRTGELPAAPGDRLPPVPPSPQDASAVAAAVAAAAVGTPGEVVCSLRDGTRARLRFAPLPDRAGTGYALVTLGPDAAELPVGADPASTEPFGDE